MFCCTKLRVVNVVDVVPVVVPDDVYYSTIVRNVHGEREATIVVDEASCYIRHLQGLRIRGDDI